MNANESVESKNTGITNAKKEEKPQTALKSVSAVWEEAVLLEFIYAIGHLNHVEQHLIESDANIELPIFSSLTNEFRELRKLTGQVLFGLENIKTEGGNEIQRTAWESIWCALKHSSTALIHIDECIEKMLKNVPKASDEKGKLAWFEGIRTLLMVRKRVMEGIVELVRTGKANSEILKKGEIRCREDICLEELR